MSEREPLMDQEEIIESDYTTDPPSILQRPLVKAVLGLLVFVGGAMAFILLAEVTRIPELQPLSRVAQIPEHSKLSEEHVHQRMILVGDVHGMFHELKKLLNKVGYNEKKDHIVFLGDMITKGPDSLAVVDFAIEHKAYCVRGNHEDEMFRLYAEWHHIKSPKTFVPYASSTTMIAGSLPAATEGATVGPVPTAGAKDVGITSGKEERDMPLVKKLRKRHIKYLQSCPAILQLGKISKRGIEAVAVHGGLLWSEHQLEKQPIEDVLRLRSIVPPDYTHGSEDPDAGEPWFNRYNDEQLTRAKNERFEVFYGHDASKGLQLRRYSKGLDTKCQRGGKLSAYVVEVDHEGHYHENLVQVKC